MLHPPPLESNAHSVTQLDALKNDLLHISSLQGGEFSYDAAARITFDNFLTNVRTNTNDDSEAVQNFKARIRAHLLKLCMVLSISRNDSLCIDNSDMSLAVSFIKEALKTLELVFRGTGDSDLAMATARVQGYVEHQGMASRKELLRHLHRHMTPDTLDRILYVMTEIGHFQQVMSGSTVFYQLHTNGTNPLKGGKKP
jgi:hypothetical protein